MFGWERSDLRSWDIPQDPTPVTDILVWPGRFQGGMVAVELVDVLGGADDAVWADEELLRTLTDVDADIADESLPAGRALVRDPVGVGCIHLLLPQQHGEFVHGLTGGVGVCPGSL